ncbi:MAG: pseudouridine-5'-phosphate glycosidase [Gammaproteobacteria bacterium]|nr:pseudouridine-5'-phosphate glycosidase [Gammaproteobacteria bacterium]
MSLPLRIDTEVRDALREGRGVVALETTVLAHGLPWPDNLRTVQAMIQTVREQGAVPAAIGIRAGEVVIGLSAEALEHFAHGEDIAKVSRRDIAALLTNGGDGATTVAATMLCARAAGIEVFATGGIGGVHRGVAETWDISADLRELGRTAVAVVCSGAKSILDLPKTLEMLEYEGVPVVGLGVDRFPAFFVRDSGLAVSASVKDLDDAERLVRAHLDLEGSGLLIANPAPEHAALDDQQVESWIARAIEQARLAGIAGKALTPYLLASLAELSEGRTLRTNEALLIDNARIAAGIATRLARDPKPV